AVQPLAQLPAGHEAALAPGERGGIDLEVHRQRRLVDADRRQPQRLLRVTDGEPDVDLLDARDRDDVAGARLLDRAALQTLEGEYLADAGDAAVFRAVA